MPSVFSAAASLCARQLKFPGLAKVIIDEDMAAPAIASPFRCAIGKRAQAHAGLILLVGSIAWYHAAPEEWQAEPVASICRELVGDRFVKLSEEATKFVSHHWKDIAAAAMG